MDKQYLYAVRDLDSGKLVSNITNPSRKYWDKRANAENHQCDNCGQHFQTRMGQGNPLKWKGCPYCLALWDADMRKENDNGNGK